MCASVLFLGGWTFVYEPSSFSVRRYELSLPTWPRDLDGLEIALLADIHVGSPYRGLDKLREIVRATNAAEPELVVLAGDYVIHTVLGGTFVAPEELAPVLGELNAPLGVYADPKRGVLGNHDWWLDGRRVEDAFAAAGIRVLRDEAVELGGVWLRRPRGLGGSTPRREESTFGRRRHISCRGLHAQSRRVPDRPGARELDARGSHAWRPSAVSVARNADRAVTLWAAFRTRAFQIFERSRKRS